jgi:hypothetical protein
MAYKGLHAEAVEELGGIFEDRGAGEGGGVAVAGWGQPRVGMDADALEPGAERTHRDTETV